MMQQKFAHTVIERNVRRLYVNSFELKPVDAVVGMYGYCGYRNAKRDDMPQHPSSSSRAKSTMKRPAATANVTSDGMNNRGGNARIIVLPGEQWSQLRRSLQNANATSGRMIANVMFSSMRPA